MARIIRELSPAEFHAMPQNERIYIILSGELAANETVYRAHFGEDGEGWMVERTREYFNTDISAASGLQEWAMAELFDSITESEAFDSEPGPDDMECDLRAVIRLEGSIAGVLPQPKASRGAVTKP